MASVKLEGLFTIPIAVALMVILALPSPAIASAESPEVRLTTQGDDESQPRMVVDSDGNYHLLYLSEESGEIDCRLTYMELGPAGNVLVHPTLLTSTVGGLTIQDFAVAIDDSDLIHLICKEHNGTGQTMLRYMQLNRGGTVVPGVAWWEPLNLDSYGVDIDTDARGNAYIVWTTVGDPSTVQLVRLDSGGKDLRSPMRISEAPRAGELHANPRIGVSPSGDCSIVWCQREGQYLPMYLWFTRYDQDGNMLQNPIRLTTGLMDVSDVEVSMGQDSKLSCVYQEANAIHLMVLSDHGAVDTSIELASGRTGIVLLNDLCLGPEDDAYVVYQGKDSLLPTVAPHISLVMRWAGNGTVSAPMQMDDGDLGAAEPCIAVGGSRAGVVFTRDYDLYFTSVGIVPIDNREPVARLEAQPADAQVDEVVTFDGSGSYDPDPGDRIVEWGFSYDDGSQTFWTETPEAVHSYRVAGTYTASLVVRDDHGLESPASVAVVRVSGATPANHPPVARLSANPTLVDIGQAVVVDGSASTDVDGMVAQYRFDLGDGTVVGWTSTAQTTHSFAAAGNYITTLQVRDDDGEASENVASVTVSVEATNVPPTASIWSIIPNPAVAGDNVTFTGKGNDEDGTIVAYAWASNLDGPLSDKASFSTSALSVGIHTITFKVQDDEGAWSDDAVSTLQVKVNVGPTLEVLTDVSPVDVGDEVEFVVRYTDPENDAPTLAQLHYALGGTEAQLALVPGDPADNDYRDGRIYILKVKMAKAGTCTFHFEFLNARNGRQVSDASVLEVRKASSPVPATGAMGVGMALLLVALVAPRVTRRNRPQPRATGQR